MTVDSREPISMVEDCSTYCRRRLVVTVDCYSDLTPQGNIYKTFPRFQYHQVPFSY